MQHSTLQAFEQFGALYMYKHDDKYAAQPIHLNTYVMGYCLGYVMTIMNNIVILWVFKWSGRPKTLWSYQIEK